MLKIDRLTKNYGSLTALDQVSLEISEGLTGLLGPNGAGKSTLLKVVLGMLQPSAGSARVLGYQVGPESVPLRRFLGYMPEQDCLPPETPGIEFVAQMGRCSGMYPAEALQRAHEVLNYLRMGDERYRPISEYSGGMKQKVKLAQAIVHAPKLLLADEPTTGLDPLAREEMLQMLQGLAQQEGMNLILSTHLLHDVEQLCDQVVIINEGRLVTHASVEDILAYQEMALAVHTDRPEQLGPELVALGFSIEGSGEELMVLGEEDEQMIDTILATAARTGCGIRHLSRGHRQLEDIYLELVARRLESAGGEDGPTQV